MLSNNITIRNNIISFYRKNIFIEHPNLKAFISHGGGLGTQEASYFGVPVVCFPLFADQHVNCDIVTNKGFGIKLDIQTATQTDFDYAFTEIITNPKYKYVMFQFCININHLDTIIALALI